MPKQTDKYPAIAVISRPRHRVGLAFKLSSHENIVAVFPGDLRVQLVVGDKVGYALRARVTRLIDVNGKLTVWWVSARSGYPAAACYVLILVPIIGSARRYVNADKPATFAYELRKGRLLVSIEGDLLLAPRIEDNRIVRAQLVGQEHS